MSSSSKDFKELTVMQHPAGLFVLFFTEMWERFSYYGMRALLVLFLVSSAGIGGWEWSNEAAIGLYGTYTGLVYVTPIFGGLIADKWTGYRVAIMIGALLMTLGHASMAFETEFTFYLGLALLILGNGLFKPNISSVVGGLYANKQEKKDAAYTIFYMGINAGAFLGILLCGYVGEKAGWSYGFGLAGIFMFFGMLMFFFAQKIFGDLGLKPEKKATSLNGIFSELKDSTNVDEEIDGFNDANVNLQIEQEITGISEEDKKGLAKEMKLRFKKKIEKDRLIVIGVLAFFTIFFWMAFEQAGGSMTIFAKDFTDRILTGSAASSFTIVNTIITIVPLAVITWVLLLLFKSTFKKYAISNLFLGTSFIIIWGVVIWMVNKEFNTKAYQVQYTQERVLTFNDTIVSSEQLNKTGLFEHFEKIQSDLDNLDMEDINLLSVEKDLNQKDGSSVYPIVFSYNKMITDTTTIRVDKELEDQGKIYLLDVDNEGTFRYIDDETAEKVDTKLNAVVIRKKENEIEVPASWFGILNSLFIIVFAPIFSKIWESKYNPSAPVKFGLGLILLGLGFGILAYGAMGIGGDTVLSVSMIWLILAYLFHTLGELTLSPVGLSYVSKLSPPKLVGLMFGIWFTCTAVANKLAGMTGSLIDYISEEYSLSIFFLIFTFLPIAAGLAVMGLNKFLTKRMHGIR